MLRSNRRRPTPEQETLLDTCGDVIDRAVVLTGVLTDRPYVYAESTIVVDRLPESALDDLERGEPLGSVLRLHGISTNRAEVGVRTAEEDHPAVGPPRPRAAATCWRGPPSSSQQARPSS